jgi:hypothetical protein
MHRTAQPPELLTEHRLVDEIVLDKDHGWHSLPG